MGERKKYLLIIAICFFGSLSLEASMRRRDEGGVSGRMIKEVRRDMKEVKANGASGFLSKVFISNKYRRDQEIQSANVEAVAQVKVIQRVFGSDQNGEQSEDASVCEQCWTFLALCYREYSIEKANENYKRVK